MTAFEIQNEIQNKLEEDRTIVRVVTYDSTTRLFIFGIAGKSLEDFPTSSDTDSELAAYLNQYLSNWKFEEVNNEVWSGIGLVGTLKNA
ncbi:MAG: hypothetical protein IKM81_10765 [Fibrobacter sp.]|nr:hypothetical protein [Fibrobacter sp.]